MVFWTIAKYEIKNSMRQKSYLLFLFIWTIMLSLLFFMQKGYPSLSGFSNSAGTFMNFILYFFPLIMLLFGSFAITSEFENGHWHLLQAYAMTNDAFLGGKFIGQLITQIVTVTFGFGLASLISTILKINITLHWLLLIYFFTLCLSFTFLLIGMVIGTFSSNRWQALMISVFIWFVFIMIWSMLLLSVLNFVPYNWIYTILVLLLCLNPAEFLRVFFVSQLGGGAVFGQDYDSLITNFVTYNWIILVIYLFLFSYFLFSLGILGLKRRIKK